MNVQRMLAELAIYKQAIKTQRKASGLTQMERVIQRIATRRLIKAYEEATLDSLARISDMYLVGRTLGYSPEDSMSKQLVEIFVRRGVIENPIGWKALMSKVLPMNNDLGEMEDDYFNKLMVNGEQSPGYFAGQAARQEYVKLLKETRSELAKKVKGAKNKREETKIRNDHAFQLARQAISNKVRVIASMFKEKAQNLLIDTTRSNEFKVNQRTDTIDEDGGNNNEHQMSLTNIRMEQQLMQESITNLRDPEIEDHIRVRELVFNETNSPLSKRVRDQLSEFVQDEVVANFASNKYPWGTLWASDFFFSKKWTGGDSFAVPPDYNNFRAQQYLLEWIFGKYNNPKKFKRISSQVNGKFKAGIVKTNGIYGKAGDLYISGLGEKQMGGAQKGGKAKVGYVVTFSFDNLQSKVFTAIPVEKGITIPNFARRMGGSVDPKSVKDVRFINLKSASSFISTRIKKLPDVVSKSYQSNPQAQSALYPILMTEDTFRRSLQAKKKNKHSNVPF